MAHVPIVSRGIQEYLRLLGRDCYSAFVWNSTKRGAAVPAIWLGTAHASRISRDFIGQLYCRRQIY